MSEKAKRVLHVFEAHLSHDEQILWVGQPNERKLLSMSDIYLIPFSLFWCAFVVFWMGGGRNPMWAFGTIHFVIGMYMLWGRYVHKYLRRRNLYYAVTNRRVLILNRFLWSHLESMFIKSLPSLNFRAGRNGYGTLTFESSSMWNRQKSWSSAVGEDRGTGFYDIPDALEVYHLVSDLRSESEYDDDRMKRKVEDLYEDPEHLTARVKR